ncbi:MAG: DUF6788 family protein [Candidatus Sulfotelmatobacter sp.]
MTLSLKALHDKREQLQADLAQIRDLRPGSLTARFRKCGKPTVVVHRETPRDTVLPTR